MNRRQFLLACGAGALVACDSAPPLENTRNSADALAQAVLDGLAKQDRLVLEGLALSEREFRELIWPDLPAARPERNLPFSYVWGDLHQKSTLSLSDVLQRYGGKRYELREVSFQGQTVYDNYIVHREATLHVVDESRAAVELRVCGSLLQRGGAWKVFSYVVDD